MCSVGLHAKAFLYAGHYGVPQNRERLILLGARVGESLPTYPVPLTNIKGKKEVVQALPDGPSCADALGDLPDADWYRTLTTSDTVKTKRFGDPSAYAAMLRCIRREAWGYGYVREWDSQFLTSSSRTEHTAISRRRFAETESGKVEPISRLFKLPQDGVSNTLRAGTDGARGAFTSPRPIHYIYDRCITVREMARLHGFPDWYRLHVTKWHGARPSGRRYPRLSRRLLGHPCPRQAPRPNATGFLASSFRALFALDATACGLR